MRRGGDASSNASWGAAFERDGYQVLLNPRTAKPRQTDLLASNDKVSCLVEAKWLNRNLTVADIAGVRDRLNRVPGDLIACVFSMSDYSGSALKEIVRDRSREILVFAPMEVAELMYGRETISRLIEKKRREFRTQGRVWFNKQSRRRAKLSAPTSAEAIWFDDRQVPYFSFPTGDVDVVLTLEMPYIATTYSKCSFAVQPRLEIGSLEELTDVLNLLHDFVGLSEHGTFAIRQSGRGWCGFGALDFIRAVRDWRRRYREVGLTTWHHSEELAYYDRVDGGVLCLAARQRVGDRAFLHSGELELRVPGVPANTARLVDFSRALKSEGLRFDLVPASQTRTYVHIFKSRPKVEPLARIVSTRLGRKSIRGFVVKNPFFKNQTRLAKSGQGDFDELFLRLAASSQSILLSLRDWIDEGDEVDTIDMFRMEMMWAGEMPVLWASGTWRNVVRQGPSTSADDHFARLSLSAPRLSFEEVVRILRRGKQRAH